jgi:hypothetical protein
LSAVCAKSTSAGKTSENGDKLLKIHPYFELVSHLRIWDGVLGFVNFLSAVCKLSFCRYNQGICRKNGVNLKEDDLRNFESGLRIF